MQAAFGRTLAVVSCCVSLSGIARGAEQSTEDGDVEAHTPNLFPFQSDGKDRLFGYMDHQGKVVIKPNFYWAQNFHEGRARVWMRKKGGFINSTGELVFEMPNGSGTSRFSEGLVGFYDSSSGKYGFLDRMGNVAIEPKFDRVQAFHESRAWVNTVSGKLLLNTYGGVEWALIDKRGKEIIGPAFEGLSMQNYSEGLAVVFNLIDPQYVDKQVDLVMRPSRPAGMPKPDTVCAWSFSEGLAAVEFWFEDNRQLAGFIDKTGRFVIPPRFTKVKRFSEGLAAVKVDGSWGYVDRTGRSVIPPRFEKARPFSGGLAAVQVEKAWAFIDKQGRFVVRPEGVLLPGSAPQVAAKRMSINDVKDFRGGLALVHVGGRLKPIGSPIWSGGDWHYLDRSGRIVRRCLGDPTDAIHAVTFPD